MINPTDAWHTQTLDSPKVLNPYTLQVHHAAQLVAMVGHGLLPKEKDDSQSNMEWIDRRGALLGKDIPLAQTIRMGLLYHPFELHIFDHNLDSLDNLNLEGRTKQLAINWIKDHITALGGDAEKVKPIGHFDIPHHPLDNGAEFELPNPIYHLEMAKYRSNADLILKEIKMQFEQASEVRIWPHHFDTGLYIPVAFDETGQATHSIAIGLAVADDSLDEYYYYVNPWQQSGEAAPDSLPKLDGGGQWTKGKNKMAVLPASTLLRHTEAPEQYHQTLEFLESAIKASLMILGKEEAGI
jgi:hypothetical protein